MSKPVQIASASEFNDLLKTSKVVVTDFYADWCGPCKQVAPIFEKLSAKLSRPNQITFVKVNVDSNRDIAEKYNITALPTFMVFKQGEPAEKVVGADIQKLQRVVQDLSTMATGAGGSSSSSGAGNDASAAGWRSSGDLPKGYHDVSDQIDLKGLELLNADNDFGTVRDLFEAAKPSALDSKGKGSESDKKDWVESDTDEQLMLYMPFQALLKVHTVQLTSLPPTSSENGDDDEIPMRPKTIHVYTNRPHILGFEEAEDIPATQTVTLSAKDWDSTGTANVALRFVKFQNVTSLVLFIVDGDGSSERVRLDRIRLIGETGEKRDQGKLEKITDE